MADLTKRARLALHDMTGRVDASKLVMFERTIEHAEQLELHIVGLEEAIAQSRDRIEQLEAENARLINALTGERLENLWNAYNTGHEKDGEWSHHFMSDGEWLVRECGLDPKTGRYDAAEIKALIPQVAIRAAQIQED